MSKHYIVCRPSTCDRPHQHTVYRKVRHAWYMMRVKLYGYAIANKYAAEGCQIAPSDNEIV